MNIILEINGGLGKSVSATCLCSRIKKKYPESKLIVISFWKDVFLNNPYVDVCLGNGEDTSFYENYVHGQETLFITGDPYNTNKYNNQSSHILDAWFEMIGEEYKGELPELYFTAQELEYYSQFFRTEKPVFIIHPHGGGSNMGFDKYNWARDIPPNVVQGLINEYKDKYFIAVIRGEDQIKYDGAADLLDKWRAAAIALSMSSKRLLIDSSFQHIAAALGKKSTVLWVGTKPEVFGYNLHDNIMANEFNKEFKSTAPYTRLRLEEPLQNMPYNSFADVFDINKIKKSLDL